MQRVSNAIDYETQTSTSHILLMCCCFLRRSVLFKIHAADIEALKFFGVFLSVMETISHMLVVCIVTTFIYFSLLLQRVE